MKDKIWNHFIAVAAGAAVGVVFLGVMLSYPFKTHIDTVNETLTMLGTVLMPIITIVGFVYLKEQIEVSRIPHKREAAFLVFQEMQVCNIVSMVPERVLIEEFVKALEDRVNCLEAGVEPALHLIDFHEGLRRSNDPTPKVAVLFGNKERVAKIDANKAVSQYLSKGIGDTYRRYRSALKVNDPYTVRKYISEIKIIEHNLSAQSLNDRLRLRNNAVLAEKNYADCLEDLYNENTI